MVTTQRSITTNVAILSRSDGFIRIKFVDASDSFDLAEAKRQYEAAKILAENKKYKVLIDVRDVHVSPEKDAQEFLTNISEKVAEAVLVNSLATRLITRFYVRANKNTPVRVFSNEKKAIKWLKSL